MSYLNILGTTAKESTAPEKAQQLLRDAVDDKPSPAKRRGRKPRAVAPKAKQAPKAKAKGKAAQAKAKASAKAKAKARAKAKVAPAPKAKAKAKAKASRKKREEMTGEELAAADFRSKRCCAYSKVRKEMLKLGKTQEEAKEAARKVT